MANRSIWMRQPTIVMAASLMFLLPLLTAAAFYLETTRSFRIPTTVILSRSQTRRAKQSAPLLSSTRIRTKFTFNAALDPLRGPSSSNVPKPMQKKKNLQTYQRYLEVECWKFPALRGLEPVLQAVADACRQINRIVQRAQTDDVYGVALDAQGNPRLEETNVQGEVQQKLDVLCNTIMLRTFCGSCRDIHSVASEEEDEPRCCADVMVS